MSYRRLGAYLTLVILLLGAGYLGYWWYNTSVLPEPSPPQQEKISEDEAPPSDVDVTLPGDLQQDLEQDRRLQKQYYSRAVDNHNQGNYQQAVKLYRQAIAHSGRDPIASRSYQYLGDIYSRDGQFDQAIRLYDYSIDIRPDRSIVHYRLGMTYQEQGNLDQAEESLSRAIELQPRPDYLLARGNLYYDQGRYEQAVGDYERGIDIDGGNLNLYVNLGLAREQLDDNDAALEAYEQALEQDPSTDLEYRLYFNRGSLFMAQDQYAMAVDAFESARERRRTTDVAYNLGLARANDGNLSGAVESFREALAQSPEDPEVLTDLAHVHNELENYKDAVNYYEQALELRPNNVDILFALARLNERLNKPKEALKFYQRVVQQAQDSEQLRETYRRVGELYLETGEPEKAAPAFRNVLSIDSENPETAYNLGITYRRMGELERAIEQFRRALELNNQSVQYQLALADTLYRAGFGEEALEAYQRVKKMDPDRHEASYMIAYLHYRWGDLDEARRRFQSLLNQLADTTLQAKTYQSLGNIYLRRKRYSEAKTSYRQALEIDPSAQIYFNLGLVYVHEENWEVSATVFRRALKREQDNPKYRTALGLVLYQKGLYQEARGYLEDAVADAPDRLRTHFDLKQIRTTLDRIEAKTS